MKANTTFTLAVFADILSMNIYRSFPQPLDAKVYFSGQSLSVLLYILTIKFLSKEIFFLNIVSSAWLPFAVNDLFENLISENNSIGWGEIICGIISAMIVTWKLHEHYLPVSHKLLKIRIKNIFKSN